MLIASTGDRFTQAIDAIASRRGLSILIVGLLAFAGSATIGLIGGIAVPSVHDEFSYLLAADTFAHGRLTNPTHPMWTHFESVHIIHQPTYMSKYPPGPGAMLALGQFLTGYPIVGVWLSIGLMCAAICWMLHAWVPPRWALIGGLFSVLHPFMGIGGDWAQSYWGGALAATGGALVLGGTRSLLKEPQIHRALLTGAGLTILANSRPYEGLLVGLCAASTLLMSFIRKPDIEKRVFAKKVILPLILTCSATGAWIGYYNFRVTGNIFRLPYQVHEATYGVVPLFLWQKPAPPPQFRHARLREFHTLIGFSAYNQKRSWKGFAKLNLNAWLTYFYLAGNIFLIPLIVNFRALARWTLRNRGAKIAFMIYSVVTIGLMIETYLLLHYWAPVIALNYYFNVQAIRLWEQRDRRLKFLIVPVMFSLVGLLLIITSSQRIAAADNPLSAQAQRASLLARMEQQPGNHVVLVQYGPKQPRDREWVYNRADIDQAKVVWAHNMDSIENCKLVGYFKNHVIWSLAIERDDVPVKLSPFSRESCG
jgi:hypothetical protein